MNLPADLKYTKEHEWIRIEGDTAIVGITDYAQGELGDVVFVELPETGDDIEAEEAFGSIEAVKAVSDLFAPISGEVLEINSKLEDDPALVNNDPYGDGWMIKIKMADPSAANSLMSADDYKNHIS